MAAVSYPSHSFPGVGPFRPARVRPTVVLRPAGSARSRDLAPRRVAAPPTAATYRRRRAVSLALAIAASLAAWLVLAPAMVTIASAIVAEPAPVSASASTEPAPLAVTPIAGHRYVVQPGDTLWSIARRLQPEGDLRPLVDQLARRHGGSALQPGDRIDLDGLGR